MALLGNKRLISTSVSLLVCSLAAVNASAQTKPMVAEILPPAKSGECYAKVSVPAKYRTEMIDVQTKAPTQQYQITPASFANRTKRVMTREASSTLEATQPVLAIENDTFLVSPASSRWVRNSLKGSIPLSNGEISDLTAAGINTSEVAVGSCLYEHYRSDTIKTIPNQVLISEATEELSIQPAEYRDAVETVMVKPAFRRLVAVPAVFETREKSVLVEAAHSVWKKGTGPIQKIDNQTGEIMCRVDVPADFTTVDIDVVSVAPLVTSVTEDAVYKDVSIEKLVSDAVEKRSPVSAKFETMNKEQLATRGGFTWTTSADNTAANGKHTGRVVCNQGIPAKEIAYERTVVKTAGSFQRVKVDARFEDISVTDLVADATNVAIPVAGITEQVERRIKVEDSMFQWQSVLCETNTTGDIIMRIQTALKDAGYQPGTIDGKLGRGTLNALEVFQQDNQLSEGGVTMESIQALGVEL